MCCVFHLCLSLLSCTSLNVRYLDSALRRKLRKHLDRSQAVARRRDGAALAFSGLSPGLAGQVSRYNHNSQSQSRAQIYSRASMHDCTRTRMRTPHRFAMFRFRFTLRLVLQASSLSLIALRTDLPTHATPNKHQPRQPRHFQTTGALGGGGAGLGAARVVDAGSFRALPRRHRRGHEPHAVQRRREDHQAAAHVRKRGPRPCSTTHLKHGISAQRHPLLLRF